LPIRRLELGDNILLALSASKAIEFGEKRKVRVITPFKIIQGHWDRYKAKARMRLPISD